MMEHVNTLAQSLVATGWAHFVQLAVLAALLAAVDLLFGRRLGPHWRCALWLVFFLKLVLPPHLALPTSPAYWWTGDAKVAADPTVTEPLATGEMIAATAGDWTKAEVAATPAEKEEVAPVVVRPTWQAMLAGTWLLGVICFGSVAMVRRRRLRRALVRGEPASNALIQLLDEARGHIGLRTPVLLRITEAAMGPLVFGLRRPTVCLPRSLVARLDREQLRAVFVHELYHVRRHDLWVAAMQDVARILCFYHPAVWWVNARLARLREEATDQAVLSHREIGRQAYSRALVEAAALALTTRPLPRVTLGVIETKSQLHKRITMNLHLPRARRAHLRIRDLVTIATLALIFVPMMPGEIRATAKAPTSGFAVIDAAPLLDRIDATTTGIFDTFNRRDREAYVASFADDPVILADGVGLVSGREGVGQMYLQAPPSLVYEPMIQADRMVCAMGPWLVETGLVDFRFRLSPEAPVLSDPRQFLTIWETSADGGLRVKLLAWNKLADTRALRDSQPAQAYRFSNSVEPLESEGEFSEVLDLEASFHRLFTDRKEGAAADFYAAGATLIVPGYLPFHGREAIREYLESLPPERVVYSIERQVARVEGNRDHVLVINLFRWGFKPVRGSDVTALIAGKGVHIWERGEDGAWKILFDLPNASQRES